jgi:hypothetical protein
MQLLIAFAYLVAVRADASRARWIRVVAWAGLAAAAGFHGSLLLFRIDIRWFSYYMIAIAAAYFLPEAVLRRFVALTTFPVRRLTPARERAGAGWRTVGISMMAACVVAVVGSRLDLPGATAAGFICASVVAVVAVVAALRGSPEPTRRVATAAAAGALVLAVSVNVLPVRFQYYLYVVADLQRRGDPWGVLAAYERAERYAPRGQSRQPQIEALRSRLATSRSE